MTIMINDGKITNYNQMTRMRSVINLGYWHHPVLTLRLLTTGRQTAQVWRVITGVELSSSYDVVA